MATDDPWLTEDQLAAWLTLVAFSEVFPASVDAQLKERMGVNRFEYSVLAMLSEEPGHTLVIPKAPAENLFDLDLDAGAAVLATVQKLAAAVKTAMQADGIMINQFNGPAAGQTVFHFHMHIVPRFEDVPLRRHSGSMEDGNVLEEHAAKIRAALAD